MRFFLQTFTNNTERSLATNQRQVKDFRKKMEFKVFVSENKRKHFRFFIHCFKKYVFFTSDSAAGAKMILDNLRITIREVADDVGISFGSCQSIFTDVLGMKRAAVKIFPKLLNFGQK